MEAIVADLDTRRHDFHVAIENWQHDFNIGTIVRTANAFLAREVHIVGRSGGTGGVRWSPTATSTSGTTRASATRWRTTCTSPGVILLGVDNLPGSEPIET